MNSVARRSQTTKLSVGDFVLVVKPQFLGQKTRPGDVSKKLMHRVYDNVYQIHHLVNSQTAVLYKASDGSEPTAFKNPINAERLIPAVTWQVAEAEGGSLKRLDILQPDEVTYRRATVTGYGYGGVVQVKYGDEPDDAAASWVDLTKEKYRWVV